MVEEVGVNLHTNTNPALLPTTASSSNVDWNVVHNAGSNQNVGSYLDMGLYLDMGSYHNVDSHCSPNAGRYDDVTGRDSERWLVC